MILDGKERTMIDNFDKKIMKLAQKEADRTPKLPQNFDEHIENILSCLPAGKKRRFTWKKVIILAAALAATLSVTVTAAVNYVRQRMEAMNEAERSSHFQASLNTALLFLQIAQVIQPFVEITELFVVEGACNLLAVTGNEGDGVAFVNKLDCGFHLPALYLEFFCQFACNIHGYFSVFPWRLWEAGGFSFL